MIVARLAFAATTVFVPEVMAWAIIVALAAAFVIAAFAMSAAVIITGLALPRRGHGYRAIVAAVTPFAFAVTTAIVATAASVGGLRAGRARVGAAIDSVSTHRFLSAARARHRAIADALLDGPLGDASPGAAEPLEGRTPSAGLTGADGEQSKSGCDDGHSRTSSCFVFMTGTEEPSSDRGEPAMVTRLLLFRRVCRATSSGQAVSGECN